MSPIGIDLRRPESVLNMTPNALVVTGCKSRDDALERNESPGLGLTDKRTSIEVAATRQQMQSTGIDTKWVNSDRQLADVLTKPQVNTSSIIQLQYKGRWKIVWDSQFVSAKKLRAKYRDEHFKKIGIERPSPSTAKTGKPNKVQTESKISRLSRLPPDSPFSRGVTTDAGCLGRTGAHRLRSL